MYPKKVSIYDTTLRDGTQAEGISFSVQDKIRIAEKLDAFGIQRRSGRGRRPDCVPSAVRAERTFDRRKTLKSRC